MDTTWKKLKTPGLDQGHSGLTPKFILNDTHKSLEITKPIWLKLKQLFLDYPESDAELLSKSRL